MPVYRFEFSGNLEKGSTEIELPLGLEISGSR